MSDDRAPGTILGIEIPIALSMFTRAFQVLTAPITLLLIARNLEPEAQGFYFTFSSLLALQGIFELGLFLVVTNVASHEWASLSLAPDGRIGGHPGALSRLVSLGRSMALWYSCAVALFVLLVGPGGYVFLSQGGGARLDWAGPWAVLILLSGGSLWTMPLVSLLEGCNRVTEVNQLRLVQGVLAPVTLWTVLELGGGIWAPAAVALVRLAAEAMFLGWRCGPFFSMFLTAPAGPVVDWQREIWPMQWRLALSGMVAYFAYSLFTPTMFHYHGAVVAGRMGMTWSLVTTLQSLGMAFVTTRLARFGMFIRERRFAELDRLWASSLRSSLLIVAAGSLGLLGALAALEQSGFALAARLLPPLPTALFCLATLLIQVSQCQSAYLRAHKEEPILVMSVTTALLIGLLVWQLGRRFGPVGAASGYLAGALLMVVWETAIFLRCRALWHASIPGEEVDPTR